MDPDAVWKMLCESLQHLSNDPDNLHAREYAINCLEVLGQWLQLGGFPPKLE